MLSVNALTKTYATPNERVTVLSDVSLMLGAGETLALTGESGSGKSTLLHLIGGLDQPCSGSIQLDSVETVGLSEARLAGLRRKSIGLIFQQFNLIPSLTVEKNLAFQARLANRLDDSWMSDLIGALGISELLDRYPEQLSGGQQQRVAIGRALAHRPPLILADEPTGNLDEDNSDAVLDLLLMLARDTKAALLMVTHSDRLAARLGRQAHLVHGGLTERTRG